MARVGDLRVYALAYRPRDGKPCRRRKGIVVGQDSYTRFVEARAAGVDAAKADADLQAIWSGLRLDPTL